MRHEKQNARGTQPARILTVHIDVNVKVDGYLIITNAMV